MIRYLHIYTVANVRYWTLASQMSNRVPTGSGRRWNFALTEKAIRLIVGTARRAHHHVFARDEQQSS